ncbi:MAG: hypothetical protein WCF18_11410 [Chthoniobacteraceae bacterium]
MARSDSFARVEVFNTRVAGEFPTPGQPVDAKFRTLKAEVEAVNKGIAEETVKQTAKAAALKATRRNGLISELRLFNETAEAIADADGNENLLDDFRLTYGNTDDGLLKRARQFKTAATPLAARFIELGWASDFLAKLQKRIDDFDEADDVKDDKQQISAGATAALNKLVDRGLTAVKQLNVIMNNRYKDNATRLGEWKTASHVERQPDAKPAPTTTEAKPATATTAKT